MASLVYVACFGLYSIQRNLELKYTSSLYIRVHDRFFKYLDRAFAIVRDVLAKYFFRSSTFNLAYDFVVKLALPCMMSQMEGFKVDRTNNACLCCIRSASSIRSISNIRSTFDCISNVFVDIVVCSGYVQTPWEVL